MLRQVNITVAVQASHPPLKIISLTIVIMIIVIIKTIMMMIMMIVLVVLMDDFNDDGADGNYGKKNCIFWSFDGDLLSTSDYILISNKDDHDHDGLKSWSSTVDDGSLEVFILISWFDRSFTPRSRIWYGICTPDVILPLSNPDFQCTEILEPNFPDRKKRFQEQLALSYLHSLKLFSWTNLLKFTSNMFNSKVSHKIDVLWCSIMFYDVL